MNKRHIVIVGGGLSGLSAAFSLSKKTTQKNLPLKITVLEASDRFGGVLRTRTHEGVRMEAGADAFCAGEKDAMDLCRELGLQEDLIEAAPCFRRFFFLKNKQCFSVPGFPGSFSEAFRFLKDPVLSFSSKCRMLGEPFVPRRKESGDECLASFIRRRLGQGFYREIAKPLVQGVYMMDPERLSLAAMFPRLQQAERDHGSLAGSFLNKIFKKKEKGRAEFLTLKKGLEELVRALVSRLVGCELRKSASVRQCAYHTGRGWEIVLEDGEVLSSDSLGLAMNACDASKLLSVAAPELSRELAGIRYDSIATVNLIYRSEDVPARALTLGFLVPRSGDGYPFSSLKGLGKSPDEKHLSVRAFISEAMLPEVFRVNDETLGRKVRDFLQETFGIHAIPGFMKVERYPHAFPQYETGHLERVARIEKECLRYPGLFLTGNGFRGFGITDCVRQAGIPMIPARSRGLDGQSSQA